MFDPKVIVALDYDNEADVLDFISKVDPSSCNVKVGKELFTVAGPQLVSRLIDLGFRVFLDLKFHDIPNTVAKAVKAACSMGVWMVDIHTLGGRVMMEAAANEIAKLPSSAQKPLLIGVTVLTSMDQQQLSDIGFNCAPVDQVKRLAKLAQECKLDGVVSSAQETALIKELCGSNFVNVTPGIRPAGGVVGDQIRVMTPQDAIAAGSDYLVIGRPITQAPEPSVVLKNINHEIYKALSARTPD